MSITSYAGWPAYDTSLIVLLSSWPVYDPNPLRPNPNPKKSVSCSRVGSNIDTPTWRGEGCVIRENFKATVLIVPGINCSYYYLLEFGWGWKWAWACYELWFWTKLFVNFKYQPVFLQNYPIRALYGRTSCTSVRILCFYIYILIIAERHQSLGHQAQ